MVLLVRVVAIVYTLSIVIGGFPTNVQAISSFPAVPDATSFRSTEDASVHVKSNDRNLRSDEEDEERGILTNAKLELWLKLGYSPEKIYKKLKLPHNINDAYDLKNWKQMKEYYTMWLNKMAAKKPPTKA